VAPALTVESVVKSFQIQRKPLTLVESIIWYLAGRRGNDQTLWALSDVSFSLEQGKEAEGTLLKVLKFGERNNGIMG